MQNVNASLDDKSKLQNDTAIRNVQWQCRQKSMRVGMIAVSEGRHWYLLCVENGERLHDDRAASAEYHEPTEKFPAIEATAADLEKLKKS